MASSWSDAPDNKKVLWALDPVYGPWLQAGWEYEELSVALHWMRKGWDPADALRWRVNGFEDPRVALRYVNIGWGTPEQCRVVFHLSELHGLNASSERRLLDAKTPFEVVEKIHENLHLKYRHFESAPANSDNLMEVGRREEFTNSSLFLHERRVDAAGVGDLFRLAVNEAGELSFSIGGENN